MHHLWCVLCSEQQQQLCSNWVNCDLGNEWKYAIAFLKLYQAPFHQREVRGRRQILKQRRFSTTARTTIRTSWLLYDHVGLWGLILWSDCAAVSSPALTALVAWLQPDMSCQQGAPEATFGRRRGSRSSAGAKRGEMIAGVHGEGKCSFVRPYLCLQLSVSLSTQRGEQLCKQGRP